jgi:hypothetical protein
VTPVFAHPSFNSSSKWSSRVGIEQPIARDTVSFPSPQDTINSTVRLIAEVGLNGGRPRPRVDFVSDYFGVPDRSARNFGGEKIYREHDPPGGSAPRIAPEICTHYPCA